MDKRKSLRELQSRLADKLQAVRSGDVASAAAWLAVDSAGAKYLFPLSQSGEIFPWATTHQVAHTQDWYLGVANLRGSLYGIADFSSFLNKTKPQSRNQLSRSESRLVTLNTSLDVNCALFVDRLEGLRSTESFRESTDPGTDSPVFFGHIYIDLNGVHWQEINLQLLSQQNSFLNINAY
ncbi:MAG: chemotaxis protein CheW [Burkholderiaceae bacterium]|nr:chemotaxis protein CheW [Burkholderiaceae bacterium]